MSDKVDDLILQMQHLEAQAKKAGQARFWERSADKLKSRALKLAAAAQQELEDAQKKLSEGEAMQAKARTPGIDPREAGELMLQGRLLVEQNKPAVVKARAKVNFALDAMDEADRRAWEGLQADAQAEAHGQLATDQSDAAGVIPAAPPATGPGKPE